MSSCVTSCHVLSRQSPIMSPLFCSLTSLLSISCPNIILVSTYIHNLFHVLKCWVKGAYPWTSLCLSVLCVSHTAWCFRPWNNIIILRYHIQQNWIPSSKINCLGWKEDILIIEITFALVNVHSNFVTIDYFTILRCRIQSNTRKPLSYYNTRLHSVQHSDSQ